jgi:DNA topoisomerase II
MKQKEKPKIDKFSGNDWTRVTFWPDFQKFGMKGFDNDTLHLLQRRVYDIAGTTDEKVKVFLNGSLIRNTRTNKPITNFEE